MVIWETWVSIMKDIGVFEFYLPFLLMFAILYGILMKTNIFGKGAKNINVIVALVASLFVMAYEPVGITLATFLANLFGEVLIVVVTILALLMILGLLLPAVGVKMEMTKGITWVVIFILFLSGVVFVSSGGMSFFPGLNISEAPFITAEMLAGVPPELIAVAMMFIGMVLIIWFLHKSGEKKGKGKLMGYKPVPVYE